MKVNDKVKINFDKVKLSNISWSKEMQQDINKMKENQNEIYEVEKILVNETYPVKLKGLNTRFKEDELIKQ